MKLVLLMTGKTDEPWLRDGIAGYEKRIARYTRFESIILPDIRNAGSMPPEKIRMTMTVRKTWAIRTSAKHRPS